MRKQLKLTDEKIFLQIGDTLSEVKPTKGQCNLKNCHLENANIQFEKNFMTNYYFSEPIDLNLEGEEKIYSSPGEICYFPLSKCIGISLEDEDITMGIPRVSLGRIFENLYQIQSLLSVEQAEFFWVYGFTLDAENEMNGNEEIER